MISDDFSSETELLRAKAKMDLVLNNPMFHSDKIKGVEEKNLRKIDLGKKHRLFLLLNPETENIYCLKYLPRKNCYSKVSLNKILTIIRNISK